MAASPQSASPKLGLSPKPSPSSSSSSPSVSCARFAGGSSWRSSNSCSRRSRRFTASGFVRPRLPEGAAWMK
eukprot:scaffold4699_cov29-Phaeocystis_antarctica.AAC.2